MFDFDMFMEEPTGKGASGACPSGGSDRRHTDHLLALRREDTQHVGDELVALFFSANFGFARLRATGQSES